MTLDRVIGPLECNIDGKFYKLTRPVQSVLASIYPGKVVIGDTSKDSRGRASVWAQSDWRGGIGIERMQGAGETDRTWWTTLQQRYDGHLILPALATLTADAGVTGTFTTFLGDFLDEVYAFLGSKVFKYNNVTDSWGSALDTLPAAAVDVQTGLIGGTLHLVAATTTGYSYSTDGTSYTDDTLDTKYIAFWDDRLWGIDNAGQLWWALTAGTETLDAQLQLPSGSVTDLFVARNAIGNLILYAATTRGLYAHDVGNSKFVETELKLPVHPNAGKGVERWRDSTYYPAGLGVYKFINGSNSAVITLVGPDRDHGLPSDKRGTIRKIVGSHNDLLMATDATSAPGSLSLFASGESPVIEPDTGFSHILGWNELGYEVKWLGGSSAKAIDDLIVSNAYSTYRMWWVSNGRVYFMPLPKDIINPNEVSDFVYDSATHDYESSWLTAGQSDVDKLALRLKVETLNPTSSETVKVDFATNYSASFTNLGTISTAGTTTFTFPDNGTTANVGTTFRAFRVRLQLARGSTTTNTPDVLSITLEYRKKLSAEWGHAVQLDMSKGHRGVSPAIQFANLRSSIEGNTLVPFTFRNEDTDVYNYNVDITNVRGLEQTGHDFSSVVDLTMVEV